MIHAFTAQIGPAGLGDYYGSYPTEGDAYRAIANDYYADWFTLMTDSDEIKPGHLVRVARGTMPLKHDGSGGLWTHLYDGNRQRYARVADAHGSQQ